MLRLGVDINKQGATSSCHLQAFEPHLPTRLQICMAKFEVDQLKEGIFPKITAGDQIVSQSTVL